MHRDGDASVRAIDWTSRHWNGVQAYSDSKLFVAALAFAASRRWRDVRSNVVDLFQKALLKGNVNGTRLHGFTSGSHITYKDCLLSIWK